MSLDNIKKEITESVKNARKKRRFTQKEVADWLDITQSRYSQIENGNGSFTAEQLVILMQKFNLPLNHLIGEKKTAVSQLQNALSRLGAGELYEEPDVLPSERLADVAKVITETIITADSSRQITSLAPVIVKNISLVNFNLLRRTLEEFGLLGRLGWLLESISHAVVRVLENTTSRQRSVLYKKTIVKIDSLTNSIWFFWSTSGKNSPEDILDKTLVSQKTLEEIKSSRDPLAEKWRIITRITTDDFIKALKEAVFD